MGNRRQGKEPAYRVHAFTHWLNLTFLAAGAVASIVYDPALWLALAPLEAGFLWLAPDLPRFRASIDKRAEAEELARERAYYAEQLWQLEPEESPSFLDRLTGLFTERVPAEVDDRVIKKEDKSFLEYIEMRRIVAKLRELEKVRGTSISFRDIQRFEQVINGYLRYTIAARALAQASVHIDIDQLKRELKEIDVKLQGASPQLRNVLLEQKRLKESKLRRGPKLQATLELFRTRAEAIVHQMRNIHGQVLADPGMDVNLFLDELVERQEILTDPLGALEADQALHEFLQQPEQNRDAGTTRRDAAIAQASQASSQKM